MVNRGYYWRKDFKGWKGPALALGLDGQFVLIRHGGAYHRVHSCQLMKIKDTGRHGLVPEHKKGNIQDNNSQRNLEAVADYDDS